MGDEGEARTVRVETFFIDEYEVTNEEYAEVVAGHEYRDAAAGYPVTHRTWHEAKAYCAEVEARLGLPTVDPFRHGAGRRAEALAAY